LSSAFVFFRHIFCEDKDSSFAASQERRRKKVISPAQPLKKPHISVSDILKQNHLKKAEE